LMVTVQRCRLRFPLFHQLVMVAFTERDTLISSIFWFALLVHMCNDNSTSNS
jgi:hypothetical protein